MSHPTNGLDDVVHQRARLGILAVLREADRVEFTFLRATLELTDGNLSRHLLVLSEAGLARIDKGFEGKRPRTWIKITAAGRRALAAELASLRALLDQIET